MKKHPVIGMFALSLFVVSSSSAYALIDLNVGGGASSTETSSSSSANLELNAGAGVDSSSGARATSSTGSASADIDSSASIEAGQNLTVSRSSMESDSFASVETEAEAVLTNRDLRAYASTAIRSDANLEALNFTGDRVEVSYKERGMFLALIPVTFTAKAIAKANGEVELNYPWYAFLTLDDQEQIKTNIKIAVDTALKARTVGTVRAEGEVTNPRFTASESAEVAAKIHSVLRSSLETSAALN